MVLRYLCIITQLILCSYKQLHRQVLENQISDLIRQMKHSLYYFVCFDSVNLPEFCRPLTLACNTD